MNGAWKKLAQWFGAHTVDAETNECWRSKHHRLPPSAEVGLRLLRARPDLPRTVAIRATRYHSEFASGTRTSVGGGLK